MKVHHLQVQCRCLLDQVNTFCRKLLFRPFAVQYDSHGITAVAVCRGTVKLVLYENTTTERDTVNDVAIEVHEVKMKSVCEVVAKHDGVILKACTTTEDNSFTSAVVKSPLGDLKHTLLCLKNFKGCFLPGFESIDEFLIKGEVLVQKNDDGMQMKKLVVVLKEINILAGDDTSRTTNLDHVAFAVLPGSSFKYLEWYKKCFGFERFKVNNSEEEEGFIIHANSKSSALKMRLLATSMSYHMCSEVGCEAKDAGSEEGLKFVLGESFPNQGPNQIQSFISEHGGEGLQHLALSTGAIVESALELEANGVEFMMPPKYYYDEIEKSVNGSKYFDRSAHEKLGILMDVEKNEENSTQTGYLLQVFTKPLFTRKTFFCELIERHDSVGFGAGNISALWKAFDRYYDEQGLLL